MSHPFRLKLPASSLAGLLLVTDACNQQPATSQAAGTPPLAADTPQSHRGAASAAADAAAPFGRLSDGTTIALYTLRNAHGLTTTISPHGGTLTSLRVPDRNGKLEDIVLGFDSLAGYTDPVFQRKNPYFGALIGRSGNRVAKGRFTLDGHIYHLSINNPPNSLHGGTSGFNRRVWTATPGTSSAGSTITLSYLCRDGEEGYPGNLTVQVTYTLTSANVLRFDYRATTDKPTVLNLTNHTYFNLNYGQDQDVLGHMLMLNADRFTPVDNTLIPTSKLATVAGTPFDFRQSYASHWRAPCAGARRLRPQLSIGRQDARPAHTGSYGVRANQRPHDADAYRPARHTILFG